MTNAQALKDLIDEFEESEDKLRRFLKSIGEGPGVTRDHKPIPSYMLIMAAKNKLKTYENLSREFK